MMFRRCASALWSVFLLGVLLFQLPQEARVLSESSAAGWQQEGDMACAVMAACRQWESTLMRQGWRARDRFSLKGGRRVSVWENGDTAITVLIWEKAIDRSGFCWGILSQVKEK